MSVLVGDVPYSIHTSYQTILLQHFGVTLFDFRNTSFLIQFFSVALVHLSHDYLHLHNS